jgi:hypothetical protein
MGMQPSLRSPQSPLLEIRGVQTELALLVLELHWSPYPRRK